MYKVISKNITNKKSDDQYLVGTYNVFIPLADEVIEKLLTFSRMKSPKKEVFQKLAKSLFRTVMFAPMLKSKQELISNKSTIDTSEIDDKYFKDFEKYLRDGNLENIIWGINDKLATIIDKFYRMKKEQREEFYAYWEYLDEEVDKEHMFYGPNLNSYTKGLFRIYNTFILLYMLGSGRHDIRYINYYVLFLRFNSANFNLSIKDGKQTFNEEWFELERIPLYRIEIQDFIDGVKKGLQIYLESL
ncbi:hypothetical protein [Mycoplasma seminis]|uniref:Uncharacterized protein n=1 Tax=Mycoplasma seminis TaxID=512749 RepID=A0ABY9HAM9_9MOLU|nr:hypothetical protein [Mycoplasma seminis]WLP85655.1 hypothetical protein Q8852_00640 [Mycoplasma seminis]